jgi:16S rRNA (cytosine967-C5)-methyltransferase
MPEATPAAEWKSLYSGPRGTAVKVLNRVERTDSYLDKVLDAELRSGELNDLDKGLLTEVVHGVLRWQNRLDWVLNGFSHGNFSKSEINVKNILRVSLYQILFLERVPHSAAVNEGVEFIKRIRGDKPAGLVNAVLRNIIRNIEGIRYPDPNEDLVQYLAVFYSHPHWMVKRWLDRYGREATERLLMANNERPGMALRVNRLKISPADFRARLDAQQIPYTTSELLPHFVRVKTLSGIAQMDLFRTGMFTIQDESAALPCQLLDPRPGQRIIDLCAAPGGKSTNIAEIMENNGEIVALDKYEAKLNLIRASAERLGVKIIDLRTADASVFEGPPADRVLLDAPCSGLGTLAKKPDMKWKRDIGDIRKLNLTQEALLENAARLVKPGGAIVYSTCTIEPEENTGIITAFLEKHPEFSLDRADKYLPASVVSPEGFVSTLPHVHFMDGSFAARLVKAPDPPAPGQG